MKKILGIIGSCLLTFLATFAILYIYVYALAGVFYEFALIESATRVLFARIGGFVAAALSTTFIAVEATAMKKSKFRNWISQSFPQIILFYVITAILFTSIKAEVIWSTDELKEILLLEWSMVGISITIFLVWTVVILQYLKNKKPNKPVNAYPLQARSYIEKKGLFYQAASTIFSSVTLLAINLVIVIISSAMVYITGNKNPLLTQIVTVVGFYFCTNTILRLFFDILQPLKEEKNAMLRSAKVTGEEVDLQNKIDDQISKTLSLLEEIDTLQTIDENKKKEIKKELLQKIAGPISVPPKENLSQREESCATQPSIEGGVEK